jgi:hypothetical protein
MPALAGRLPRAQLQQARFERWTRGFSAIGILIDLWHSSLSADLRFTHAFFVPRRGEAIKDCVIFDLLTCHGRLRTLSASAGAKCRMGCRRGVSGAS